MGEPKVESDKTRKVFISYLDDNGQTVSTYVNLVELTDSLVVFKTNHNTIRLPVHRLLKIKESEEK